MKTRDIEQAAVPEPTVEEQVALMYLGTVDEVSSQVVVGRVVANLAPKDGDPQPKNADVLYALVLLLATSMLRMRGTVAFRQTILRGLGDIAAGHLEQMAEHVRQPKEEPAAPEEEEIPEWPKDYPRKAAADDDIYTVDDFRDACQDGVFTDDDGHGCEGAKLGVATHCYAPLRKIKVADFAGREKPKLLPGTTHIIWFNK